MGGGPLLCSQKGLHLLVCLEDGAGRAGLGPHVSDGGPLRYFQRFHARAGVLKNTAQTTLDAHPAQQFQDDILGVHAGAQAALHAVCFQNFKGQ